MRYGYEIDDEVLHISNSPRFFSKFEGRILNGVKSMRSYTNSKSKDFESVVVDTTKETIADESEKIVAMTTQDIFYFEYGCVVFWGLTQIEETAAISELKDFTTNPVDAIQLEKR